MRSLFVASMILVLFVWSVVGTAVVDAAQPMHSQGARSVIGGGGNDYHDGPSNKVDPIISAPGTVVEVTTSWGYPGNSCKLSSSTSGLVTHSSCSVVNGDVYGSFVVGHVPAGTYLIQISTNQFNAYTTLSFTVQS